MTTFVVTSVMEVAVQHRLFAPMQALVRGFTSTRVKHTDESSCDVRDREAAKGCFSHSMVGLLITGWWTLASGHDQRMIASER